MLQQKVECILVVRKMITRINTLIYNELVDLACVLVYSVLDDTLLVYTCMCVLTVYMNLDLV